MSRYAGLRWAVVQLDGDGNAVGIIDGRHEFVLETDPTGCEMGLRYASNDRGWSLVTKRVETMSMCHKAYALEYGPFSRELAPLLFEALATGDASDLAAFVDGNAFTLTFPWEASPLPDDWRSVLNIGDAHEIGDLALTKYYDADDDCGLQEFWSGIDDQLDDAVRPCLLGAPFGPPENPFDPGRMGSYFQDPSEVARSRDVLLRLSLPDLSHFVALLEQAARAGRGLYVTF